MAEAFGIAAGVAGFVSLLVQINSGIETLHDIRKQKYEAPKELQSLTQELQFLADIMQRVIQSTPSHDASALQHCQTSCDEVIVLLSSLEKKFFATSKEHGPRKFKILAFRQWKEAVDNLHRGIQAAKINLTLSVSVSRYLLRLNFSSYDLESASYAQTLRLRSLHLSTGYTCLMLDRLSLRMTG